MKIFVLIQMLICHIVLNKASLPTEKSIDQVLKWLEVIGERKRDEERKSPTAAKLEQFITFTVMASKEIHDGVQLKDDRVLTKLNVESCGWKLCRRGHGEYNIIHEGTLQRKIEEFRSTHPHETPHVVLFSHFVPCYGNPGVPYSCAEELGSFVFAYGSTIKFIVGFRAVYEKKTDIMKALTFMVADGITVFEKKGRDFMNIFNLYTISQLPEGDRVLQELYFKCLHLDAKIDGSDLFESLTTCKRCLGCESKRIDELIAFNINMLICSCTKDMSSVSAKLSRLSKKSLRKCFETSIDSNAGTDCQKCRNKELINNFKIFLKVCSSYALLYSTHVGHLYDQFNPYSTRWHVKQMFCNDAYRHDFASLSEQRPAALPQLETKSFCTTLRKQRDLPNEFKVQVRDIDSASRKRQLPVKDTENEDPSSPGRKIKKTWLFLTNFSSLLSLMPKPGLYVVHCLYCLFIFIQTFSWEKYCILKLCDRVTLNHISD